MILLTVLQKYYPTNIITFWFLYGLGLIDTEMVRKQYESIPKEAKFFADQSLTSKLEHDKLRTIHKMMIDLIRRIA